MEFRLTYDGPLTAFRDDGAAVKARAPEKHDLRRQFHRQLKHLWQVHPNLCDLRISREADKPSEVERIAKNWVENGYRFVPLVRRDNHLICKVEVLMLRPGGRLPGDVIQQTGDIDNRLKTIFDALRKPRSAAELAGSTPSQGEDPFFVLLEDDALITYAAVETDTMLQPVGGNLNDVRLVIKITTGFYKVHMDNLDFA